MVSHFVSCIEYCLPYNFSTEACVLLGGDCESEALAGEGFVMQVELSDGALHTLIETYCREAGVRNLQKHIEKIYRKVSVSLSCWE